MASDIGVFGLGVMGENIALNLEGRGYEVSVYNRTAEKTKAFISGRASGRKIRGFLEIGEFIRSIARPRRVLIFVSAGSAVDEVIESMSKHLERGDVVIDCGNSHFRDSDKRFKTLAGEGLLFVGAGVSGGEEGALKGPSIMAGGSSEGYESVREIFESIAARFGSSPCTGYFGPGGAGHFVKIIHNGIEYAMIQAIAEVYDLLRNVCGMGSSEIGHLFLEWNKQELTSFLLEAAGHVLCYVEEGKPLVELIVDEAEQKGTGRWASQVCMDLGVPAPSIDAAVSSRIVSSLRRQRVEASKKARRLHLRPVSKEGIEDTCKSSLYAAFLSSYSQGLAALDAGSKQLGYGFSPVEAIRVWRAGCIIRSKIVEEIYYATLSGEKASCLMIGDRFRDKFNEALEGLVEFIELSARSGTPTPVISSVLNLYYSYTSERLPANLVQAIRDYFGSHQFRRLDIEGRFHSTWGRRIEG